MRAAELCKKKRTRDFDAKLEGPDSPPFEKAGPFPASQVVPSKSKGA